MRISRRPRVNFRADEESTLEEVRCWYLPGPADESIPEESESGDAEAGSASKPQSIRTSILAPSVTAARSDDVSSALNTINKVVMTKSLKLQEVTRFVEPGNANKAEMRRRKDQVSVFIRSVFLKVGEIDTIKETFSADVFIQARWREPLFDRQPDLNPAEISWSEYWNPQLYVDNCVGEPKETIWQTVMFNDKMEAFVFERRRVAGSFVENLKLCQFPFDTQNISLAIVSQRSVRELSLEEDYCELSTVNSQSFADEQKWRLYMNVETRRDVVIRIFQGDNCSHPSFSAICHASRRFGFYFWNILFVMFFICSMTFATFAVNLKKTENRLQLTLILLLTTITFKYAVNQSLPRISYLTYMDKYILTSMVFMCTICVWHATSSIIPDAACTKADLWVLVSLALIYVLSHVAFYVFIYIVAIRKRNIFIEKERIHKARIKHLEVQVRSVRHASTAGDLEDSLPGPVCNFEA